MSVDVADRERVWVLSVHRPPVNAVNLALVAELGEAFARARDDATCTAIVLTGMPGVFCAGVDTREVPAYDAAQRAAMLRGINRTILTLYGMPKPVVAAVSGHALGAGLVLPLACDLRIAARGAFKLGLTEVEAGVPFPAGPLAVLQAEVPPDRARVLSLTGAVAEPGSPLLTGLIDEVVEPAALVDAATSQARSLAAKPAFARVKAQLRRATLERLRRIVEHDDEPLLQSWI
jgi:enoyl-CoA hydratase